MCSYAVWRIVCENIELFAAIIVIIKCTSLWIILLKFSTPSDQSARWISIFPGERWIRQKVIQFYPFSPLCILLIGYLFKLWIDFVASFTHFLCGIV